MNRLGYRQTDEGGLSFVLEVDGEPLAQRIGSPYPALGYRLVAEDLPRDPSGGGDSSLHIVGACSCGELACGYTRCRVRRSRRSVELSDFEIVGRDDVKPAVFRIPETNYDEIVSEIVGLARQRRIRERLR